MVSFVSYSFSAPFNTPRCVEDSSRAAWGLDQVLEGECMSRPNCGHTPRCGDAEVMYSVDDDIDETTQVVLRNLATLEPIGGQELIRMIPV